MAGLTKKAAGLTLRERNVGIGRKEGETLPDILDELDKVLARSEIIDLSGAGITKVVFYADRDYTIEEASFVFTEASSADVGSNISVGKMIIGTDDVDYFVDEVATAASKETAFKQTLTLLKDNVSAGDVVTFVSAGGKTGTGEGFLNLVLKRA